MKLKVSLILLTLISVVADTMILPFYPQFFEQEFGVTDSLHIGAYIAACCFTVMIAFPYWAKVARKVEELQLWVVTQIVAGALGITCFLSTDLISFWVLSQLMLVFKASYLLIYPYVLRLEEGNKHLGIVGLFSVLMHFGGIGGAILGGITLEHFEPKNVFLIMAASDAIQVILCAYLVKVQKLPWRLKNQKSDPNQVSENPTSVTRKTPLMVYAIGIVSLLFYMSSFVARPYFSLHWHQVFGLSNEVLAGMVYAIPAWVALVGLWLNKVFPPKRSHLFSIQVAIVIGAIGLLLQAEPNWQWVILGRCLLGYALFVTTVRLEVILFEHSEPDYYGADYSKVHLLQNVGIIAASFTVGSLMTQAELNVPFYFAAAGFLVTFFAIYVLLQRQIRADQKPLITES